MNVLSLFDGMSCGRIALDRAGIEVSTYYASEIDKYATKVSEANYPDIIRLGDVTKWRDWDLDWSSIDLIFAGFPCQSWSTAGKQLGDKDERGMLFWIMLDIMKHVKMFNPNFKFLIENVKMKKEFEAYITHHTENAVGSCEKTLINSALVSAQNRNRYIWTNWSVTQPEDKGVVLADIIDQGVVDRGKSYCIDANYYKGGNLKNYIEKCRRQIVFINPASLVGRRLNASGVREDSNKSVPITQCLQVKHNPSKMHCLTTVQKDTLISSLPPGRYPNGKDYRKLTPIECERLQTVPDNYTNHVSNTQRYKMLGNGWTVDVIAHILGGLNIGE